MKKRFLSLVMCGLITASCVTGCQLPGFKEKSNISYLYVDTYSGGFGEEYLNAMEIAFEQAK